jgi:hypothetical protein
MFVEGFGGRPPSEGFSGSGVEGEGDDGDVAGGVVRHEEGTTCRQFSPRGWDHLGGSRS